MQQAVAYYRPDIDGLRAVAVLGVLVFHAGAGLPGGFVGVDIFFVISGYLITQLICRHIDEDRWSLRAFWGRRIRRIVPAALLVTLATMGLGLWLLFPKDLVALGESAQAQVELRANFHFWLRSGYWQPEAETMPLLHTWSLAVEEQFYLFFPLLLAPLWRRSKRAARLTLAALCLASLGLSGWMTPRHPEAAFYLLPTRAWELLVGTLLAVGPLPAVANRHAREALAWVGLGAIGVAFVTYDGSTTFPGVAALLPVLGAACVIHANTGGATAAGRLLSLRPMVVVGLISYSLYLWHWPLLAFADYRAIGEPSFAVRLALLAVSFPLAWLSWRFVETPLRRGAWFVPPRRLAATLVPGVALLVVAATLTVAQAGWPGRFDPLTLAAARLADHEAAGWTDYFATRPRLDGVPLVGHRSDTRPRFLLIGDSHANAVVPALERDARRYATYGGVAATISPRQLLADEVGSNEPGDFAREAAAWIRRHRPRHVVLATLWNRGEGSAGPLLERGLTQLVAAGRDIGAETWIMLQAPRQPDSVPRMLALGGAGVSRERHLRDQRSMNQFLRDFAADAGARILDPADWLFDDHGNAIIAVDGAPAYVDDNHLSRDGALMLSPMFAPIFADMPDEPAAANQLVANPE